MHGFSRSHAVLSSQELGAAVLRKPMALVHNKPAQQALMVRVFGAPPASRDTIARLLIPSLEAVQKNTSHEARVRPLIQRTNALVGHVVPHLVPTRLADKQSLARPWLVSATPQVIDSGATQVDLYALARDLTTYTTLQMLAGSDYMRANPSIVADVYALDSGFPLLAAGMPTWLPLGVVRRAVAARNRMLAGTKALAIQLDAIIDEAADEPLRDRMADINELFYDRARIFRDTHASYPERAAADLALIWASTANTAPFVFWVLAYIVTHKVALTAVREEIAPYVVAADDGDNLHLNTEGIVQHCPKLKAVYLETFRLASAPTSMRQIAKDLEIDHSASAGIASVPLRKGLNITVSHSLWHHDPQIWPEPETWRPERFLRRVAAAPEENSASPALEHQSHAVHSLAEQGTFKVVPGSLRPWGDGAHMCKGRVFAEREVLLLVAAVLGSWDVASVLPSVPDLFPGTGVMVPSREMLVRLSRRF